MARFDLTRLRKEHGITQKELAEKLGLSQGFLSSVESHRNSFPEERVKDLQSIFPDTNLADYDLAGNIPSGTNIGSNNNQSKVNINDDTNIKVLLDYLTKTRNSMGEYENESENEIKEWQKRYDDLLAEMKILRQERDEYFKNCYELKIENLQLKELLRRNNIDYEKDTCKK